MVPPDPSHPSKSREMLSGILAELPLSLGGFPFGMIYGVIALQAGIPAGAAQAMSSILFAGSSQFIAAQLIGTGVPAIVVIITAFIVNLRHALYSASVAPFIRHLSPFWKGILAYLLTDEAYVIGISHYEQPGSSERREWYFLGAGLSLWISWQISTALGIFLGTQVPASWQLDFTLALTFIALAIPLLKEKATVLAAGTAGLVALAAYGLPYKLGLILAALAGIAAGMISEGAWKRSG